MTPASFNLLGRIPRSLRRGSLLCERIFVPNGYISFAKRENGITSLKKDRTRILSYFRLSAYKQKKIYLIIPIEYCIFGKMYQLVSPPRSRQTRSNLKSYSALEKEPQRNFRQTLAPLHKARAPWLPATLGTWHADVHQYSLEQ